MRASNIINNIRVNITTLTTHAFFYKQLFFFQLNFLMNDLQTLLSFCLLLRSIVLLRHAKFSIFVPMSLSSYIYVLLM